MKYRATCDIAGRVHASAGDEIELKDKSLAEQLSRANIIEPVKKPAKGDSDDQSKNTDPV